MQNKPAQKTVRPQQNDVEVGKEIDGRFRDGVKKIMGERVKYFELGGMRVCDRLTIAGIDDLRLPGLEIMPKTGAYPAGTAHSSAPVSTRPYVR